MGESIPLAAPVPVEQAVLETFFSHLGIFSYDKAKDNVDKEREANKSAGGSWLSLLAALAHLAAAEKVYHSLTYLGQKLGTSAPPPVPFEEEGKGVGSLPRRGLPLLSALPAHLPATPSLPRLPQAPPTGLRCRGGCGSHRAVSRCVPIARIGALSEKLSSLPADTVARGADLGNKT